LLALSTAQEWSDRCNTDDAPRSSARSSKSWDAWRPKTIEIDVERAADGGLCVARIREAFGAKLDDSHLMD
jgi:hypothetical protein